MSFIETVYRLKTMYWFMNPFYPIGKRVYILSELVEGLWLNMGHLF